MDTKVDQTVWLLEKSLTIQTAAFGITNCGSFYDKLKQFLYYKTEQLLLQNVAAIKNGTVLLQNKVAITKQDNYYKTGHKKANLEQS